MSIRRAELEKELFSACEAGDVDRVRKVIAAGVDPKKAINKDLPQFTPLHTACWYVIMSFTWRFYPYSEELKSISLLCSYS